MGLQVIGLENVLADFAEAAASAPERADKVVDKTKTKIRDTARDNAPVRTGEFRDGIVETEDGVEATAPHSPFVEFGTVNMGPQPTVFPAADQHEGEFVSGLEDVAGDV